MYSIYEVVNFKPLFQLSKRGPTLLDGELVRRFSRDQNGKLQPSPQPLFVIFDMLKFNGRYIGSETLDRRQLLVESFMTRYEEVVKGKHLFPFNFHSKRYERISNIQATISAINVDEK